MNLKKALALLSAFFSLNAVADLKVGDAAPDFSAQATQGGKVFAYHLKEALSHGPVVLYFYPAAFTPGCTLEAHNFAEATDEFKSLGASVIGASHDPLEKLQRFSVSECRSKFPVLADVDGTIMKRYDATMALSSDYASRTSYVISPEGKIIYAFSSMSPDKHVENTMKAVKQWKAAHSK